METSEQYRHDEKGDAREEKESAELTPQKLWQLFFNSYLFSQGDADLQGDIFKWLHLRHPEWRITDEHKKYILNTGVGRISRYMGGKHHSEIGNEILSNMDGELKAMKFIFNEIPSQSKEDLENTKKELIEKPRFLRGFILV